MSIINTNHYYHHIIICSIPRVYTFHSIVYCPPGIVAPHLTPPIYGVIIFKMRTLEEVNFLENNKRLHHMCTFPALFLKVEYYYCQ